MPSLVECRCRLSWVLVSHSIQVPASLPFLAIFLGKCRSKCHSPSQCLWFSRYQRQFRSNSVQCCLVCVLLLPQHGGQFKSYLALLKNWALLLSHCKSRNASDKVKKEILLIKCCFVLIDSSSVCSAAVCPHIFDSCSIKPAEMPSDMEALNRALTLLLFQWIIRSHAGHLALSPSLTPFPTVHCCCYGRPFSWLFNSICKVCNGLIEVVKSMSNAAIVDTDCHFLPVH